MIPRLNVLAGLAAVSLSAFLAFSSAAVAAPISTMPGLIQKAVGGPATNANGIVLVHERRYYKKKRSRHYRRYHRRDHWRHRESVDAPFTRYRRYNRDIDVDAPFASVRRRHHGVYVRAPFVDLYVPRWR